VVTFPAMSWSKLLVIALGGALLAGPAFAQDDDELMQLSPKKKAEPKAKPRPKAKPKAPPRQPVTSNDDELTPLTPSKGELVLKAPAAPRRAKVSIDDREVGTLPIANQSLSPGEHMIAVRAPGYTTWTRKVNIVANKPTEVTVALEAHAALVSVSSDASGAQVAINGKPVGTAPIEELEVPPGATTITVRKEGYKDATQTLKLVAGKEYPLSVKLGPPVAVAPPIVAADTDRPENPNLVPPPSEDVGIGTTIQESPPVYTRWYFWAGAVAVVAAVAVGTAVGVSNSQPRPLGEQGICGPTGCDSCIGFTCTLTPSGIAPFKF